MSLTLFDSAATAYDKLALPEMPGVGFILNAYEMGQPYPVYVGPVQPVPERGQNGRADEWTKPSPVPADNPRRSFIFGP